MGVQGQVGLFIVISRMNSLRSGSYHEPDFSMALARIQRMNKDELNELLNNEDEMDDYIKSLDQIKNLYNEKEELMVANKSLAEYNLSQEPHLTAKKTKLTEKHREAIELVSAVKEAKSKLESKTGKIQPDSLYYLLEVDASKAESESDEIVNQYLDKTIENTDDFLEQFLSLRKTMYMRRVKMDKMKEIIQNPPQVKTPARKAPEPPPAPQAANLPYLPYPIKPNVGIPNPNYH